MKIITLAAWRRPDYFAEVVKSLGNAEGIDDYLILVALDGGYPQRQTEMVAILRESKLNYEIHSFFFSTGMVRICNKKSAIKNRNKKSAIKDLQ